VLWETTTGTTFTGAGAVVTHPANTTNTATISERTFKIAVPTDLPERDVRCSKVY